jgi:hypothetical protein
VQDFSIKDECDRCGSKDELDGVIHPHLNEGQLSIEQATLCLPCREEYEKYIAEENDSA